MTDLNVYGITALIIAGTWLWHILMCFFFYRLEVLNFRNYLPLFDALFSLPDNHKHNFESVRDRYHGVSGHRKASYLESKGYGNIRHEIEKSWHYFTLAPKSFSHHFPYPLSNAGIVSLASHSLFALPYLAVELGYIEQIDNFLIVATICLLLLSLMAKAIPFIFKMRNIKKSALGLPYCLNRQPPKKLGKLEKNYILLNHILLYHMKRGNAVAIHQWIIALHHNKWPIIDDFLHFYCIAKGQHPAMCLGDFPEHIRDSLIALGDNPEHIFSMDGRIRNTGNPFNHGAFKVWV